MTSGDQEVVHALHLAALGWPVAVGQHGGAADEAKVPAEAQQDQGERKNARSVMPISAVTRRRPSTTPCQRQ